MEKKLGQEPAFATSALLSAGEDVYQSGMSKRFYAACCAMQGIASAQTTRSDTDNEWITKTAFNMADELLKQENL